MSQMNPYMTNPNAELYAMLGQRAANLDRQGGGVSAGSGIELDLLDKQAALAELAMVRGEDRAGRARALDAITRRGEMQTQEEFMMRMAERQRQLILDEQDINLELANADIASTEGLLAKLAEKQKTLYDFNTRKLAAEAEMARRNPEMAKQYSQRIREVSELAKGLSTFKDQFGKSLNAETTITNFLANPNKGGFLPESGGGSILMTLAGMAEGVQDFFGEDAVDKPSLRRMPELFGSGGRDMVAAALDSKGLADGLRTAGFDIKSLNFDPSGGGLAFDGPNPFEVGSAAQRMGADRFSNNVLSELAVTGLANSGANINIEKSQAAMTKLIGELNDISRSSVPMKAADVSARLKPILDNAATEIFGETPEQATPKLVELLDETFKAARTQAGKYAGAILDNGEITRKSIQNAAIGKALERGGALGYILQAGTKNQVLTSTTLQSILGMTKEESLVDPDTGRINYGLLDLDPNSEMGALIRGALGSKTTAQIEDFLKFVRSNKQTQATLAQEQGASELDMMRDMLTNQAQMQRQALEAKRGILGRARQRKTQ